MGEFRVVHYLNQFFGGLGGEGQADAPPVVRPGPLGPGLLLQELLGEEARIVGTVVCGDNRMAERPEETVAAVLELLRGLQPGLVVAGPAFGAGRYGVACAAVCAGARRDLGIPALTAMHPENPGLDGIDRSVLVGLAGPTAATMRQDLERLSRLIRKTARGEPLGPSDAEGYFPRGRRVNEFGEQTGAERMVEMLLRRLRGEPFVSEVIVPRFDRVPPAPPVPDLRKATLAIVTTSGVVPQGNPDGIESWRATRWARCSLGDLAALTPEAFTCVHGGYDNRHVRANPHRAVPLDVLRRYEKAGRVGRLHGVWYSTVGNVMPVERARRLGLELARELREGGVQAVLLTAT